MASTRHSSVWRIHSAETGPSAGTSAGSYANRIARSCSAPSVDRSSSDRQSLTWMHEILGRTIDCLTRFTVLLERRQIRGRFVRIVAASLASVAALVAAPAQGRDHEV